MRIAARYADEWNCWGLPELMAHKRDVLERHCTEIGRDPGSIRRSAQALVILREDGTGSSDPQADSPGPRIVGSAPEVAEVMNQYADIGLDEFIVLDRTLGRTPSERRDAMDKFMAEVAAPLQDRSAS